MSDKRETRDMGELLGDSTYAGILIPVVPDLELRILKTIEASPERFEMRDWFTECGTAACLAGHATLIAQQFGFADVKLAAAAWYSKSGGRPNPPHYDDSYIAAEVIGIAMWLAIGKEVPDFRHQSNREAIQDLRQRVERDLTEAAR